MTGPFAGSTIPPADYGGTQLAGSQQFDSLVGAGLALASQKIYMTDGQYLNPVSTRYQQLISAGVQIIICYRPPFAGLPGTTYPSDLSQLGASVAAFVAAAAAAGAPPPKAVLWQEPQNGSNNMSAAQCGHMFGYYAPAIRSNGAKCIYDTATHGGPASMVAYYPGAALCDEVLADFYGDTFNGGIRVDGPGSLLAQAHTDGKPFGWGELGSALSAGSVPSQAVVRAYMAYCIGIILGDLAAGLQVSDSMWYNGVTNNWNTINSGSDFRVSLLLALWNAYQPGTGPPPPPPVPQPLVPSSSTSVTFGPPGALDAVLAAADDGQGSRWPGPLARQHIAFDPQSWSALMPNPQTIPSTLTLQGTPPLNIPGATAGLVLVSDASGNFTPQASPAGQYLCPPVVVTGTTYTTTSATFGALASGTVATGSFIAPASGEVVVEVDLVMQTSASITYGFALAATGTVTPLEGFIVGGQAASSAPFQPVHLCFPVTGLTPGASTNLDLLFAVLAGDTLSVPALGNTSTTLVTGDKGGPVTITVKAV